MMIFSTTKATLISTMSLTTSSIGSMASAFNNKVSNEGELGHLPSCFVFVDQLCNCETNCLSLVLCMLGLMDRVSKLSLPVTLQ